MFFRQINRLFQHAEPAQERVQHNEHLEQKVEQLQNDLTRAEVSLNKLKVELKLREMELKRKSDDFMQLTSEIKVCAATCWFHLWLFAPVIENVMQCTHALRHARINARTHRHKTML